MASGQPDARPPLPSELRREAELDRAHAAQVRQRAIHDAELLIARAGDIALQAEEEGHAAAAAMVAAARHEAARVLADGMRHADTAIAHAEDVVRAVAGVQTALEDLRRVRAQLSAAIGDLRRAER